MAAVLALLCSSSRVAWFGVIFMGQTTVQEKDSSGVGTVQVKDFY